MIYDWNLGIDSQTKSCLHGAGEGRIILTAILEGREGRTRRGAPLACNLTAMDVQQLLARTHESFPQADLSVISRAYEYAMEAHGSQKRKSGEPYIAHPMAVAELLAD